jgi:DNA replication protein DnaC
LLANLLEWDLATAGGKGISLVGPTGGCKTRMMFLLLRKLHYQGDQGVRVGWIRAVDLSRASSEIFDGDNAVRNRAREVLKNALRARVLFIDDLGKERFTDRAELELYNLIESRISSFRPTLWTTNLSGADLRELMSKNRGPTIIQRLNEFSTMYFVSPLYERANPIVKLPTSARSA